MPYCPCCQMESAEFLPFGVRARPNARCPRCGALERHRLLALFLRQESLGLGVRPLRVLHVAPEPVLARLLRRMPGVQYVSADLMAAADVRLDITALPFPDGAVDVVVCNHVLEHVPDDRQAMREFRRVLNPDGWAILLSPMDPSRAETYEDFSIVDPAAREQAFGQYDHVRVYGRDYYARLRGAGFAVEPIAFGQQLGSDEIARCALSSEPVVLCRVPGFAA